jgi:hypothetical protein
MRKRNPRQLHVWIPDPRSVDSLGMICKNQSTMSISTFWRALWYLVLLALLTLATVLYTLTWSRGTALIDFGLGQGSNIWNKPSNSDNITLKNGDEKELPPGMHPIENLMNSATKQFDKMAKNEIHTLEQAAAQYRKLRGRHPPPGFDAWYVYATSHNAIINEKFWDQIYHDLAPFWGLDPVVLRKQAHVFTPKLSIRNGKVDSKSHNQHAKLEIWENMLETLSNAPKVHLPDMDIPLNVNMEPAMLVDWEAIDTALSLSRKIMLEPSEVVTDFSGIGDIENLTADYTWAPEWLGPRLHHPSSHLGPRPLWSLVRPACPPHSPARLGYVYNDIWDPEGETRDEHFATALLPLDLPAHTLRGYTKNWTNAMDACQHPNLQALHTSFVAPKEMGIATKLFPLFGDRKFAMGNEILLPDWNISASTPSASLAPWSSKSNTLHWRGLPTSARGTSRYWRYFHRERLVAMLNATHVEIAEAAVHTGNESTVGAGYAGNFRLLPANEYRLRTQRGGELAEWVASWADAGFSDSVEGGEEYFSTTKPADDTDSRYAIELDSDADSLINRLQEGKVTLRATVYRKWFDSRLVPWLHFVPMDNTLVDLYGIMEYFLGAGIPDEPREFAHAVGEVQEHAHNIKSPGEVTDTYAEDENHKTESSSRSRHPVSKRSSHGDAAQRIAEASKVWADKVLRREDKLIYVYRLLLEYTRLLDDKRDRMGWVDDLR